MSLDIGVYQKLDEILEVNKKILAQLEIQNYGAPRSARVDYRP